jgi:four helix bundle protein
MADRDLKSRTKKFALRVIRLAASLPSGRVGDVMGRQLLKSGTSIGANYREAARATTKKHFISTIEISIREADETHYWLELLAESGTVPQKKLTELMAECSELLAMLVASAKTAKRSLAKLSPGHST